MGGTIQEALNQSIPDLRQAYKILQSWYHHSEDRPPRPSRTDLETITNKFRDHYTEVEPPGEDIPVHVEPSPVNDEIPTEEEIIAAVSHLHNNKATGQGLSI